MTVRRCTVAIIMLFIHYNHVVTAQEVENFSCDFSGCVGEDMVCCCSVAGGILYWWDGNSGFCSRTVVIASNPQTDEPTVEVVANSPSGGFTSKLTRRNISTELNGTEIGCSQSQIDSTCRPLNTSQNSSFTLLVQTCRAPNPPSGFTAQDSRCNSTMRIVTLTWTAPEPALSQFPVTHYSLTYTSSEGNSRSETLPADTTSYNLTIMAGVQYTITVSALSNGRESQGNPQLNFDASFCNDTTLPTSNTTETTTAGTPSTPTSIVTETMSTPTTNLGSIIGGSIGGSIGALILIISIIIIVGLYRVTHKDKKEYKIEKKEKQENKRKEGENRKKLEAKEQAIINKLE